MTDSETFSPISTTRRLVREARTATLSTLVRRTGHPFGSLVTIATEPDGTPVVLLSTLAAHSRNLADDPRASLMIQDRVDGDPQAGARVTLVGRVERIAEPAAARRRYLVRNPDAALYADFADFSFHRLVVEDYHLVAGFGRAMRVRPVDVRLDVSTAGALIENEARLLAEIGRDEALVLDLARRAGGRPGRWSIVGLDPEGVDLATTDDGPRDFRRMSFDEMIIDPEHLPARLHAQKPTSMGPATSRND